MTTRIVLDSKDSEEVKVEPRSYRNKADAERVVAAARERAASA